MPNIPLAQPVDVLRAPEDRPPEPLKITGRAGDLLLAHYLLGHNIGGNDESDRARARSIFQLSYARPANRRE